jgi:hypothetical protein
MFPRYGVRLRTVIRHAYYGEDSEIGPTGKHSPDSAFQHNNTDLKLAPAQSAEATIRFSASSRNSIRANAPPIRRLPSLPPLAQDSADPGRLPAQCGRPLSLHSTFR